MALLLNANDSVNRSYTITKPSPNHPLDVNGVGVRTENKFDVSKLSLRNGYAINDNGVEIEAVYSGYTLNKIPCAENTEYTISNLISEPNNGYYRIYFYNSQNEFISRTASYQPQSLPFKMTVTTPLNCSKFAIQYAYLGVTNNWNDLMINSGATAKPYEPYGYKIPILNGQQTTNIYLGSTQTVRQIKKLVLTGNENIFVYSGFGYIRLSDGLGVRIAPYSDKLLGIDVASASMPAFSITQRPSDITPAILAIKADSNFPNVNGFKTWLAENQITVWYVLATPETGIVNEPLMKIGEYADTVSNAASIPTTGGANSITVDTTVQPSEFTATWTGWHNAMVKEWDGSQWNE